MEFADRIVVVTGAGGGVGRTVTERWLQTGARVVAVDRSAGALDALGAHARLATCPGDLLSREGAEEMVRFARSAFGAPDTLVHTVGGFRMGPIDADSAVDNWSLMMDLNVTSNFHCYRAMLPSLRERKGGYLVGIASRAAVQPMAKMAAYAASKAALIALTQSMADELRNEDIHVNVLLASTIDTPANRAAMGDEAAKKWVSAGDIAEATMFLCSERAKSVHGATLEVYGKA